MGSARPIYLKLPCWLSEYHIAVAIFQFCNLPAVVTKAYIQWLYIINFIGYKMDVNWEGLRVGVFHQRVRTLFHVVLRMRYSNLRPPFVTDCHRW